MQWEWNGGFSLRSSADTEGRVSDLLSKLEGTGKDMTILRLVANSPHAFRPFVLLANSLVNQGALADDAREALILHLAAKEGAVYEVFEHVDAARAAGLSDSQLRTLLVGDALAQADQFPDDGVALALRLGDVVAGGASLSDAEWEAAIEQFGPEGALDLVFAVAWWGGFVLTFTRAIGLRAVDGATPLDLAPPVEEDGKQ